MLAVAPGSVEEAGQSAGDDDLQPLEQELERVGLPRRPEDCRQRLLRLRRIQNRLHAIELDHIKLLKQADKRDPYDIDNAASWVADVFHLQPRAAYARVCAASELEEFPTLDRQVHQGEVSPEATTVILNTLRRVRGHLSEADVAEVEKEMLVASREMDHAQLRAHGAQLFHLYNGSGCNDVMRKERERRFFDLRRRQDGWYSCEGNLDPEGGSLLETALQAVTRDQKCEDDDRTAAQARADALSGLAEHRLAFGDLPEKGQERPHMTIVVTAETLRGDERSPAPQIDWGTPVSGEAAKRIACDAIARIGLVGDRGDGIVDVLHMGRAFRTTTVAQRKALELQDGGCIWCGAHPKSCAPHHWEMWSQGGRTDHENLGLVCPVHHFALHEGGYRAAEVSPDRVVILAPDGHLYREVPRHRWNRIRTRDGTG